MDHIAIDLGSRESQVCIRTAEGQIIEERRVCTRSLGKYLAKRPKSRVVLESCAEAFSVADVAMGAGHETVVVPATLTPSLGVGERGVKTDCRDARNLSEASCRMSKLPSIHVPAQASRNRKSICNFRETLVQTRTKLINSVRGWMRSEGLGVVRSGAPTSFPVRVRTHAAERSRTLPAYVEPVLVVIDKLTVEISAMDDQLEEAAESDATCRLLMTAPGIGPTVSMRYTAAIDQVSRFPNAHRLQSYLGLTPGERLEQPAEAEDGADEGWAIEAAPGAHSGGVGGSALLQGRPARDVVIRGRETPGETGGRGSSRSSTGRNSLCDVAGRKPYDKAHQVTRATQAA